MAHLRLLKVLPVFLIALLVQVYAPVGSSLAMARASSDPIFAATICDHASDADGQSHAPGLPLSHNDCCPLCQFVHSGAAPLAPLLAVVVPQIRPAIRADWVFLAERQTYGAQRSRAQARAPPSIS